MHQKLNPTEVLSGWKGCRIHIHMTTSPPAIGLYSDRSAGGELLRLRSFVSIGKRGLLLYYTNS